MGATAEFTDLSDLTRCKRDTVKDLLTAMSADTYTFLNGMMKGTPTDIKYDLFELADKSNTGLSGLVLLVNAKGEDWSKTDNNVYIWKQGTVKAPMAKKVVQDMYDYYMKNILKIS
jgi:hypothetical protein